jgi:C-terminal processing protease CtpA/Prc
MKRLIVVILLIPIFITSCKKKDVTPAYTTDEMARDHLYDVMNQYYLWYDLMPVVTKENYKTPYTLLDAMMYKTFDRWSFVETYDEYLAQMNGTFVGHGIRLGLDPSDQVRIVMIYKNSDLYSKGVRRGWIVKTLNGTALAPIFISGDGTAYNNLIGPSQAGVTNTFVFHTPAGKDSTVTSTKSEFITNPVLIADTLHLSSGVAGHIVLEQFFPPADVELDSAFALFNRSNVSSLIVDLRYNGGGVLDLCTTLASYMAGSAHANTTFLGLNFNNKNTDQNTVFKYKVLLNAVTLTKIVFINSRYTASASEDVINGLKPIFNSNIVCLGDTSGGKPVGMNGFLYGNSYLFWPITFKVVNSLGEGDFYSGIPPAKYVTDDITHDFPDRNEVNLKEAIYYLEHGTLSSKGAYLYKRSVQFSEKPDRLNNALFIDRK